MALLNMCPAALKEKLMNQPDVASFRISFDDLEKMIVTQVHNQWDKGRGVHALNQDGAYPNGSDTSVEFESLRKL